MARKLDVVSFGRTLFETGDLDPVYVALNGAQLSQEQLHRWLVAYWLFYSAAFAGWASERSGGSFWQALGEAAENTTITPVGGRWPRGAERRHFRGTVAPKAVSMLQKRYGANPGGLVDYLASGDLTVAAIMARAKEHYLFGGWIAFKIADMLDAVCGVPVVQDDLEVFLYDTPRNSILDKWQGGLLPIQATSAEEALLAAMYWLGEQLCDCRIPHKPQSRPDWFSLETVWCKHGSHVGGHYPLFKDTRELAHDTLAWAPYSATVCAFAKRLPKVAGCLT